MDVKLSRREVKVAADEVRDPLGLKGLLVHFVIPHFRARTETLRCRAGLDALDLGKPSCRPGHSEADCSPATVTCFELRADAPKA
jgi:hypothetical protein